MLGVNVMNVIGRDEWSLWLSLEAESQVSVVNNVFTVCSGCFLWSTIS